MPAAPLDRLDDFLSVDVRGIVSRETPIPTIAARAAAARGEHPGLVRADIGQIVGVDPEREVPYGPPVGFEALREAVAETYTRTFRIEPALRAANVAVTTGAAEALSLLFRCFVNDGVVGLPRGHWENYRNGAELARGRTVVLDFFDAEGNLDASGLRAAIEREGVTCLVVNFPCNPTGAVLSEDEVRELAWVVEDAGVIVIADEVYARLRYDGAPPVSLMTHAPGHVVSVGSASKEYLAPGARVGWAVSFSERLTDGVLRRLTRANTASPNVLGQRFVLQALESDLDDLRAGRDPRLLVAVREAMRTRRDNLLRVLDRHGFTPVGRAGRRPEGTIFLMAGLPSWWSQDDVAFVDEALARGCLSAIPGSAFGVPGAIRLSYGAMGDEEAARLDENLTRFRGG